MSAGSDWISLYRISSYGLTTNVFVDAAAASPSAGLGWVVVVNGEFSASAKEDLAAETVVLKCVRSLRYLSVPRRVPT